MAMVHQLPEGNMTNRDKLEDGSNTSENSEASSRPSSRSSAKSNTPDPLPQYQYSKEELMKLSDHPYTKKRPACLDPVHVNTSGKWDPERWFISKRNEKISHFEEPRSKRERADSDISITHKRRTSDPKERVREERDDIVLSPQRRSFGTGCHVMQQSSLARRPGSPGDNREIDNSYREPSRRIGSGRIITRDREQREWDRDHRERDYGYGGRNDRRDRYDQDDEKEPRRFSNRFGRGERRISRGRSDDRIEEEEPEWFSGGPTSQSETIELVGFDDIPNDDDRKNKRSISKRSRENSRRHSFTSDDSGGGSSSCTEKGDIQETGPPLQKGLQVLADDTGGGEEDHVVPEKTNSPEPDIQDMQNHKPDFDLDDIFKMDWFPGLIPNGTPPDRPNNEMPCSRFSQWFKRESPILGMQGSGENSRRSSLQDELIAHVLNAGIGESQLFSSSPPNNSDSYFTPISPAISHNSHSFTSLSQPLVHQPGNEEGKNILEILQNATFNNEPLTNGIDKSLYKERADLVGKAKSVEELEADLKRLVLGGNEKGHEEDKSVFNRLLQHLSDGQTSSPSLSIGPLDKSKALQEEDLLQNIMGNSTSPLQHTHMYGDKHLNATNDLSELGRPLQHGQHDLFSQLIQQAQQQRQHQGVQGLTVDMLAKLLGAQQSGTPSLSPTPSSVAQPGQHHPNMPFNNHNEQQSLAALIHQQRQRDIMNTLLKQQQQQVQPPVPPIIQHHLPSSQELGPLGIPPVSGGISPRQSPLPADNIGAPLQGRIPSPLVFGQQPPALSHAPAPIHPAHLTMNQSAQQNSNTLQVQNPLVLPRVPSPQELAVHTQSILQNALIKRKLEEQKENFRKRQEAQRTRAPNATPNNITNSKGGNPSPPKGLSPTMAAFTPTSVMKKMHSEKLEKEVNKIDLNSLLANKGHTVSLEEKCSDHSLNGPQILGNSGMPCSMDMNNSSSNQVIPGLSSSINSLCTSSNVLGPRAVHGQGATNHTRSQNHSAINSNPSIFVPSHGRPIVKGGNVQQNTSGDHVIRCTGSKGGSGSIPPQQPQNKPFLSNNPQNSLHMHHDMSGSMDSVARVIEQQRLLQRQQVALAAQRQLNTSPMPPIPSGGFGLGPRAPAINSHHSGLVRPGNMNLGPSVGTPNLNLPLFRSMVQANLNNPALRAQASTINQLTQFSQLAALQQQLQRGTLDSRQLQALAQARGLHPIALQQLLLNAQTQAAAAMGAASSGMVGGRADSKNQHLLPGQPTTNRQSPVNLAKWFGNDVLKQKMPDMPPVPHQKALLVEEIERQQQQSTTVHN